MKLISFGKAYIELLENKDLSEHFLTPKIFKSMKFVGHSSAVLLSFHDDISSIVSTLKTLGTDETNGLLNSILRVDFILDFLFLYDIMNHLSSCSKLVQRSSTLPWNFPTSIDSLIYSLEAVSVSLTEENISVNQELNTILLPKFSSIQQIITTKEYKKQVFQTMAILLRQGAKK